jgi:hypothetical protein
MILEPGGVAKSISNLETTMRRVNQEEASRSSNDYVAGEKTTLLLFSAGGEEQRACPLNLVTRLEDLDASTFEMTQRGASGSCHVWIAVPHTLQASVSGTAPGGMGSVVIVALPD